MSHRLKERKWNKIDEAWLSFVNGDCFPVTKERDREVMLAFQITLIEEFVEEEVSPIFGYVEVSGGVADIA